LSAALTTVPHVLIANRWQGAFQIYDVSG